MKLEILRRHWIRLKHWSSPADDRLPAPPHVESADLSDDDLEAVVGGLERAWPTTPPVVRTPHADL